MHIVDDVVLTGMPGVGKSTVGVVLARRPGFRFMKSDLVIQEHTGMLLYQIMEEKGNDEKENINQQHASIFSGMYLGLCVCGAECRNGLYGATDV